MYTDVAQRTLLTANESPEALFTGT